MKKVLFFLILASTSFVFSRGAYAAELVFATGYGVTQQEATGSANSIWHSQYGDPSQYQYYGIHSCEQPPVGPPWKCVAYGARIPQVTYVVVTASGYGLNPAQATQSATAAWENQYGSQGSVEGVSCQPHPVGPPWKCVASGRIPR